MCLLPGAGDTPYATAVINKDCNPDPPDDRKLFCLDLQRNFAV